MTALVPARVGLFTAPVSGTGPWREEELLPQVKTLTLHLKVKPESGAWLNRAAREVDQVWNWANATSKSAVRRFAGPARWLSSFELDKLSAGSGELFECITSDTVQRVNAEFVTRRQQFKKSHLRFRKSHGSKRSLGWVPFKGINLRFQTLSDPAKDSTSQTVRHRRGHRVKLTPKCGTRLKFAGKTIRLFQMRRLLDHREGGPLGARLLSGNFAQNALGEWFLNVSVERPIHASEQTIAPREIVGIDPGLKAVVTTSDGEVVEPNRSYRNLEAKMAQAQRRGAQETGQASASEAGQPAVGVHPPVVQEVGQHVSEHQVRQRFVEVPRPESHRGRESGPGFRSGNAQGTAPHQRPLGREKCSRGFRKPHHASLQRLWGPSGPHRSGRARCETLGVLVVSPSARSRRQRRDQHPRWGQS